MSASETRIVMAGTRQQAPIIQYEPSRLIRSISKNTHMENSGRLHCLLLLFLLLFFFCHGTGGNTTEMETLLAFKHQFITSDPSNALGAWNSSFPLCNWTGITCTRGQAHVAAIELSGLALSGTIPPLLSNLSSLISLDLSNNSFHGSLPQHLGRLSLLQRLLLNDNSFTGTIPHSLSNCSNLLRMDLSYNKLHGNLPPSLGLLAHLEVLALSVNSLADEIPPSIGNLTSLKYLYLLRNQFSSYIPQQLGGLRNLAHLQIAANQLTGMIPSSIYNISSIQIFSVAGNQLVGQLPKDMGFGFPNLTELYMGGNYFTGTIPSSLSNISGIQYLNLPENHFQGSLPSLGNIPALLKINLAKNRFSSSTQLNKLFFDSLTNCTLLEELSISDNQLAGSLPVSAANLSAHLVQFNIDQNLFSGSLPLGMYNYPNLTMFDVSRNSFVGNIPRSWASLHNLQFLLLSQNHLGEEIPDIFSNLTWLYQLNLSHNHFFGRIPRSIGDCQRLGLLDLSTNNLTGNIPKEIFNLRSLTFNLSLAGNSLKGFLPLEVGKLDKVQFMNFSDNQLSGAVPFTIGDCVGLQNLGMARNQFEGPIPKSMGNLIALENLDLSSNDFIGGIPDGLGKLEYLRNLNLSFNHLQGLVPVEGGVFTNLSWSALQGNDGLCSDNRATQRQLRIPRCAKDDKSSSLGLKIILPVAILSAILGFLLCLKCTTKSRIQKLIAGRPSHHDSFDHPRWKISYKEISSATDNFSSENLIGDGSFGSVYKGILRVENATADVVAVKVLDLKQSRATSSFTAESEILGKIRHRNLVKIITSCSIMTPSGAEFKAIVMKFMSNGNLARWLHHSAEKPSMSGGLGLLQRLNISIDVAAAMKYLHHECDPPVVHCDLKPSNVLLDDEMIAHVGDFGLAKIVSQPSSQRRSSLGLKGSIGYIAPEYNYGSQVSTRGDVYSYGILLLEIFIGKKPTDEMFKDEFNLKNFASKVFQNPVAEIVDKSLLEGDYYSDVTIISTSGNSCSNDNESNTSSCSHGNLKGGAEWCSKREECLVEIIRVALSCAADFPKERPNMRETLSRMHRIKREIFSL